MSVPTHLLYVRKHILVALLLLNFGCGEEQANSDPFEVPRDLTDGGVSDVFVIPVSDAAAPDAMTSPDPQCNSAAPSMPSTAECRIWNCTPVAYPSCWSCQEGNAPRGTACMTNDGEDGQCVEGICENAPNQPDMGTSPTQQLDAEGPEPVTTTSVELSLGTWPLNETQTLTLHYPTQVANAPAVIFHHGFGLSAQDYASYGAHLASWGFAVIMPNTQTGIFGGPTQRDMADMLRAIVAWLDASGTDNAHPLSGKISTQNYLLAGHSLGGKLSFLVASETNRVAGIFGIDPVDTPGGPLDVPSPSAPSVTPELMPTIDVPMVIVGETTNATSSFGPACAPSEDNFERYYEAATAPALKIEFLGANHMSFLDNPNCGFACLACPVGTDDPSTTRRLTQKYLVAFAKVVFTQTEWARELLTTAGRPGNVDATYVTSELSGSF